MRGLVLRPVRLRTQSPRCHGNAAGLAAGLARGIRRNAERLLEAQEHVGGAGTKSGRKERIGFLRPGHARLQWCRRGVCEGGGIVLGKIGKVRKRLDRLSRAARAPAAAPRQAGACGPGPQWSGRRLRTARPRLPASDRWRRPFRATGRHRAAAIPPAGHGQRPQGQGRQQARPRQCSQTRGPAADGAPSNSPDQRHLSIFLHAPRTNS